MSCCGVQGHEELVASNPAAYLPFGSGGRQCIGQRFALQEVRLGLVQLMQRFHYDIDWNLMVPAGNSSSSGGSSKQQQLFADVLKLLELLTLLQFSEDSR